MDIGALVVFFVLYFTGARYVHRRDSVPLIVLYVYGGAAIGAGLAGFISVGGFQCLLK